MVLLFGQIHPGKLAARLRSSRSSISMPGPWIHFAVEGRHGYWGGATHIQPKILRSHAFLRNLNSCSTWFQAGGTASHDDFTLLTRRLYIDCGYA